MWKICAKEKLPIYQESNCRFWNTEESESLRHRTFIESSKTKNKLNLLTQLAIFMEFVTGKVKKKMFSLLIESDLVKE